MIVMQEQTNVNQLTWSLTNKTTVELCTEEKLEKVIAEHTVLAIVEDLK